ncbi:uncharacterized protein MCYG_05192 [Microsporum canis CBS 113480]|uniref:Uncharacterized protein n=1 Tax=Arthroderma otae (strain ATCC MYA-4605 / CBS 113480) TaxID=554155 RepID=C5FR70_ARTOC|nr:uncharacterized protein MCYG_05192 [Microsporum canis CBS 113480]EEQ32373.1 predicted protein [Microsporum canis CBS 113480]
MRRLIINHIYYFNACHRFLSHVTQYSVVRPNPLKASLQPKEGGIYTRQILFCRKTSLPHQKLSSSSSSTIRKQYFISINTLFQPTICPRSTSIISLLPFKTNQTSQGYNVSSNHPPMLLWTY